MSKLLFKNVPLLRRSYSVAAENTRGQQLTSTMKKTSDLMTEASSTETGQIFWMRDPKTGNWLPENSFDEVNVVELREKLLSKKNSL